MVYPDFETFTHMARQGNLIPVYREILGDLETPVSAYNREQRKTIRVMPLPESSSRATVGRIPS